MYSSLHDVSVIEDVLRDDGAAEEVGLYCIMNYSCHHAPRHKECVDIQYLNTS